MLFASRERCCWQTVCIIERDDRIIIPAITYYYWFRDLVTPYFYLIVTGDASLGPVELAILATYCKAIERTVCIDSRSVVVMHGWSLCRGRSEGASTCTEGQDGLVALEADALVSRTFGHDLLAKVALTEDASYTCCSFLFMKRMDIVPLTEIGQYGKACITHLLSAETLSVT